MTIGEFRDWCDENGVEEYDDLLVVGREGTPLEVTEDGLMFMEHGAGVGSVRIHEDELEAV